MADTLATLIKLAEQKVERVQQRLATAQRQLAEVHLTQQKWRDDMARADADALKSIEGNDAETGRHADLFNRRATNELAVLAKVQAALDDKIEGIRTELNQHFAEQKRYEILHEQKQLAARKKLNKKLQDNLDEAAGQRKQR